MCKAAIGIDEMPNNCEECLAFAFCGYGSKKWCDAANMELPDDCDERKPEWCRVKKVIEGQILEYTSDDMGIKNMSLPIRKPPEED